MAIKLSPYFYLLRQCFIYVGSARNTYILALVLLVLAHAIWQLSPYVLGQMFNSIQKNSPNVLSEVMFWLGLYAAVNILPWVFWKPARQWERQSAFTIRQNFYDRHYHILRHLPLKWHQDHHSGNTINRLRKASESLFFFSQEQYEFLSNGLTIIMALTILLFLSPVLALAGLACYLGMLWIVRIYDRRLLPMYDQENEKEHNFFEAFFDYVSNMTTVLTLRLGERSQNDLIERHKRITPIFQTYIAINENKYLWLTVLVKLSSVLVMGTYTWIALKQGSVQVGTLVMLYQYFYLFTQSCYFFAWKMEQSAKWYTSFQAAEPILNAQPTDLIDAQNYPDWHTIQIDHLSFRHNEDQAQDALHDLSVTIRKHRKIALVGRSGSGKSTLLAALRGLYVPNQGSLSIDGMVCTNFHPLYDRTTLIPQDPEIFESTIRQNLTLGMDYSEQQIMTALQEACFDPVVAKLPKGLESDIREKGVNLSGGEKQRLAFARGLLASFESDILLLDEPTSSIDAQTESKIVGNLFENFANKTVLIALHRLHLLPRFDEIWMMQDGQIIERGHFAELVARNGAFARLWQTYQGEQAA